MISKKLKRAISAVSAVAMLIGTVSAPMINVSAESQLLGETDFNYQMLPWNTYEVSPAKQLFFIEDGALHVMILKASGADGEKWDLGLRHRGLDFKAKHEYEVSFKAKASRDGLQLDTHIGNLKGEEYFVINEDKMEMGPDMKGNWGKPAELSTEWQEFSGTFIPNTDVENAEWTFQYAKGTKYYGNAKDGDEIWFDDMSIICKTCDECVTKSKTNYGISNRNYGASKQQDAEKYFSDGECLNFISANQLGYHPNSQKIAVLGDNQGDIFYGASKIKLDKAKYDFEVCDAKTDEVVYFGTSSSGQRDADSMDTVYKLDFTEFKDEGRYYIRVGEWRSFEFNISNDIYSEKDHDMLTNALNYFYQNRAGMDIDSAYITSGDSKGLAHKQILGGKAYVQKSWINKYVTREEAEKNSSSIIEAKGGWYDAGTYSRSVVNGGLAAWTLQNMYEMSVWNQTGSKFDDASGRAVVPETENGIPDVLDEAAYELEFMESMVVSEDDPTWGKHAGLVYHQANENEALGFGYSPHAYECDTEPVNVVLPPTFAATLNYAACSAQAARLWAPYDKEKAQKYLENAKNAYEAYLMNYYEPDMTEKMHPEYYCPCAAEELNETSQFAPSTKLINSKETGRYPDYLYGSDYETDSEAYWALCELFVSAKELGDESADNYYKALSKSKYAFKANARIDTGDVDGSFVSYSVADRAALGTLTLAMHPEYLDEKTVSSIRKEICNTAGEYINEEYKQGYGIPYVYDGSGYNNPSSSISEYIYPAGYEYGSNTMVLDNALIMAYAYSLTADIKYINGVTTAMDYLLGTNPFSFSYITGYGSFCEQNPSHKYWVNELDESFPKAPDGVITSGPCSDIADEYVKALGFVPGAKENPSQRCFADSVESWSTNEATLKGNATLAWVVSFIQDELGSVSDDDRPAPSEENIIGDADMNGVVDMSDLTLLSLYLLGDVKLSAESIANMDVDKDGEIKLADLAKLKQYVSKVITEL